jgi:hypothetical protein
MRISCLRFSSIGKKSIPDAILNPRYSSLPYEYIEGGEFRVLLNTAIKQRYLSIQI